MRNKLMQPAVVWIALGAFACGALAQSLDKPAPPPPPVVPILPPTQMPPQATPTKRIAPPPPAAVQTAPTGLAGNPADLPATVVAWDSLDKSVTVEFGTINTNFTFGLTNVSPDPVTVVGVHTSCGCTTAQLPPMPWKIDPGSNGVIHVNMNVAGRNGTVIKSVSVMTDKGTKHLIVRTIIQPLPTSTGMAAGTRERNQMLAAVDRQMVFKGDCASCHLEPAKGKMGAELFTAACGVCHDAEHRATVVPDLKVAKQDRNADFWRNWITNGKQGSLMPAFGVKAGGILSDEQIESLVDYLLKALPAQPANATKPAPPVHLHTSAQ